MSLRVISGLLAASAPGALAVSLGWLRGGPPGVLAPVEATVAEVAQTLKVYVYELPANVSMHVEVGHAYKPQEKGDKSAFERAFNGLIKQSARRVYDPSEADFFYVPVEPISFFMERRENPGKCTQCVEADRRTVEYLRSVGPYWDQRRAQHIVPGVKCPTHPWHAKGWRLFPQLWGGGAMQLCLQATRVQVDTYRALHVGYYMNDTEFDSQPLTAARDLLAVYCGSVISGYRQKLVDGMRQCPDCAVLEVPQSRQLPADFAQRQRELLRRARFQVVPPGDTLERAARDQSIGMGAVPVIFDYPSGLNRQLDPYQPVLDWNTFSVNFTLTEDEVAGKTDFWPRLQARLRELKATGRADTLAAGVAAVRDRFRWDSNGVLRTVLEMLAWRKMDPVVAGLAPWPVDPSAGADEVAAREGASAGLEPEAPPHDRRHALAAACLLACLLLVAVAPILPRDGVKAFLMALVYLGCLVLVRPLVKNAMQNGFPYPYAITISHMIITALVASAIDRPRAAEAVQVLPLALVNGMSLVLGNTALVFGTAAFVTMVGAYTPATTLLLVSLANIRKPVWLGGSPAEAGEVDNSLGAWLRFLSSRSVLAVLLVSSGAMLCIRGEVAFSSLALLLSTAANFCRSFKTVWQHGLLEASLSPYRTVAWTGIWSALLMLPIVARYEGLAPFRDLGRVGWTALLSVLTSAVAATMLNISQCLVVKYLGPVQQTLIGNLQIIMVMVLAMVWLDETVVWLQWVGTAMIISGCTMTKSGQAKHKLPEANAAPTALSNTPEAESVEAPELPAAARSDPESGRL